MKRCKSSLYALAVATGAGLLLAVPAMAQTYNTFTDNFDSYSNGSTALINGARGANYNYTQQTGTALVLNNGKAISIGSGASAITTPFFSRAEGGTGNAISTAWQSDFTSAGTNNGGATSDTGFEGWTSYNATHDSFPTIDMTGQVSFDVYIDSTTPGTVLCQLMINGVNTEQSASDVTALGKPGGNPANYNFFTVGAAPSNGANNGNPPNETTPGTAYFPTGGKPITTGSWQTVTFNIATDPHTSVYDPNNLGWQTSGLGYLYDIDFTPVSPGQGNFYSANIDNLVITAAPEPSAWLGLAAGGAMLLGLGLVSARRRRGANAA